jgi:hypothetical protein
MAAVPLTQSTLAQSHDGAPAEIYARYQDVDLDYFFASSDVPRGHPLYRGLEMPVDTVTASFDGLRTEARFNGRDRSVPVVLDTGGPRTSVSRAFAEAYNLPVDTSVAVGRSIVPALDINAPKYPTRIDRMEIGGVVLKDIPATVTWTDPDSSDLSRRPGAGRVYHTGVYGR